MSNSIHRRAVTGSFQRPWKGYETSTVFHSTDQDWITERVSHFQGMFQFELNLTQVFLLLGAAFPPHGAPYKANCQLRVVFLSPWFSVSRLFPLPPFPTQHTRPCWQTHSFTSPHAARESAGLHSVRTPSVGQGEED